MFGLKFIKVQPTEYVMQFRRGRLVREGVGLSFAYFAPWSSLVRVPVGSVDVPFIFEQITKDFQQVSVQGQIGYRVADAKKLATLMNFTIDSHGAYSSDDPEKLPQRLVNLTQVLTSDALKGMPLREALAIDQDLVLKIRGTLAGSESVNALGIEILDMSILAVKPTPETARAMEAETREQILKHADEAIYNRRNAAVEQERAIKENELNTEIAIENKKRQIRETQMEAEKSVQQKQRELQEARMATQIALEDKNTELVKLSSENSRLQAEMKAYGMTVMMNSFSAVDAKVLQSLASTGMSPSQLIAQAFRDLAESSDRIGTLNVTPDLLREIMAAESPKN